MTTTARTAARTSTPRTDRARPRTRTLLTAAALAGPFFFVSSTVQALARPGFDLRIHPLSQLATGGPGWIQQLTFVLAGLGFLALAVAYRRMRPTGIGRRLVPVFLSIFGAGIAAAGIFPMDPQLGFPIGAPAGPVDLSWHSIVHSTAAAVAFTALAGACITALVRHIRARNVAASIADGLVALVLLLPVSPTGASIQVAATGLIAYTWVTGYALALRRAA
ncbi:DUF998 domain-containing protein [Granulicoccus phenolivorans]|uniref:DUF998 domain-containing protein n=1 Tax=Granulicoccus phenolivorans TaxID=266854 RepID=UPI000412FB4A|nr:DUF998 domain-containing protein [Granulicoccus phenolivorans]